MEKFIEPLYEGTPSTVVDTLPALMNSIKMIHTIARYYNTTDRMTNLFRKITNQMIINCRTHINKTGASARMWDMDPTDLVERLEVCLKLNEAYQEQYRLTKDKLMTTPKGKQFDFSDQAIFGKFDLFCRRLIKLIDMFSTIHQFRALAAHKVDGMEGLTQEFTRIITSFRAKAHDLLAYDNNKFDRDYVEFNVRRNKKKRRKKLKRGDFCFFFYFFLYFFELFDLTFFFTFFFLPSTFTRFKFQSLKHLCKNLLMHLLIPLLILNNLLVY